MNKFLIVFLFGFLAMISPVFAGTLTVTGTSTSDTYIATNQTLYMLNLSMVLDAGIANLTSLNITMNSTDTAGGTLGNNISAVEIRDSSGNILGTGTVWNNTINKTTVTLTGGGELSTVAKKISILIMTKSTATKEAKINVAIDTTTDFGLNETETLAQAGTWNSSQPQIQDVRATATISPRFVDTGVINQSFQYNLSSLGSDIIQNITINLPFEYSVINVTAVKDSSSENLLKIGSPPVVGWGVGFIEINYSSGFSSTGNISINFTADTNSSSVTGKFNSTIIGWNITGIQTNVENNNTNVTTLNLITVQNVTAIKTAAFINGADYWLFNFTLNISANASGMVQFKMSDWNNSAGNIMNLSNQSAGSEYTNTTNTQFYSTFWKDSSDSANNYTNVTNEYNITSGISFTAVKDNTYNFVLKMIIPSGTPVASDWWTTYWMVLRSLP